MVETWNPVVRIRHEWSTLKTCYGKVGLVWFYALVWLTILTYMWSVIDPTSQGMDCIVNGIKGSEPEALFVSVLRGMAIMALGFLLYVQHHGFHMANVAFTTVVVVPFAGNGLEWSMKLGCVAAYWSIVGAIVGMLLALILVYLEGRLGAVMRGTAEERAPLAGYCFGPMAGTSTTALQFL